MIKRLTVDEPRPPLPPVTRELLERHLDMLAGLMHRTGKRGRLLLPVYRRVKRELDKFNEDEALMDDARRRATAQLKRDGSPQQ
ncbi:MAG: hypothetical protein KF723_22765 [Rhizobiaceae bacterium]|nr:hypothetical protein [Rhizobiaceae bacterium]